MAERQRLSVVILTKNEETRITRCLDSVTWADEVIVVDGQSTDRTVDICRQYGARVISHAFEGSFATERNLGLEHARGDWVLQIDADDVVTPQFREAVERLLANPSPHAALKFRRKSYLLGRFMRYGGWYHYLPNLVRRNAVRYEGVVHERPIVQGTTGVLDADIEHHPCESLTAFLDRHNRYTSLHALELVSQFGRLDDRQIRRRLIRRLWKVFWKSYIKKQGFREGLHGLVFSIFFAGVELIKWAKYWELGLPDQPQPDALRERQGEPRIKGAQEPPKSAGTRATLSVVLMTKNEETGLAACLDRVAGWADEIVVIDDLSTDHTVEIAHRYTDQVFSYASEDNHDRQWNRGIEHARGDWILHIDADERVTPSLKAAIDRILVDAQGHSAFEIMRKNFFLGHPMRYGGWYHRHLILFRRDAARCVGKGIHVQLQVHGSIGFLDAQIEHYPFRTITQFLERQNRYTTVEARVLYEQQGSVPSKTMISQVGWRPPKLFWKSYIKNHGYREGMCGLVFALLYAFVHVMFWAKYWELVLNAQAGASLPLGRSELDAGRHRRPRRVHPVPQEAPPMRAGRNGDVSRRVLQDATAVRPWYGVHQEFTQV